MHKAPLATLFLVAILAAGSVRAADPPRRSSDSVIDEITRLTTVEWPQANMRSDVQWFERHFADELLITNGQTGEVTTKTQELESVRSSQGADGRAKIEDLHVNVYDNVAVTVFKIVVSGTTNTRPYHRIVRHTEVWVFRDGRWQLVALHGSPLPQQPCEPEFSPGR